MTKAWHFPVMFILGIVAFVTLIWAGEYDRQPIATVPTPTPVAQQCWQGYYIAPLSPPNTVLGEVSLCGDNLHWETNYYSTPRPLELK